MRVPVSEAKGQLTDLVRRAERGEEVVLTRHGHPAVRLVAIAPRPSRAERRQVIAAARALARQDAAEPGTAHAQDFLYGQDGMPS